jgi:hypothetical protein
VTIDLNDRSALRWIEEGGISSGDWRASALPGGVSSTVILVEGGTRRLVLKQALEKLKVADDWRAPRARLLTEASALELAGTITPDQVPAVVRIDAGNYIMAIDAAPADWRPWKQELLEGTSRPWIVETLAECLARWHDATAGRPDIARRFHDPEAFHQLRLSPYYQTVAARLPDIAEPIQGLIRETSATGICLVHGDFSPKNVLVGDDGLWVIDWEVAHLGDPSFDVAFLTSHLVLKWLHTGEERVRWLATSFVDRYEHNLSRIRHDQDRTRRHLGALLLSRVHGKSPVEYLSDADRSRAAGLGRHLLYPGSVLADAWRRS